jgi:cytochrome c
MEFGMRISMSLFVVGCIAFGVVQPVAAQDGDPDNGKSVFRLCRPCHQVGAGAKNGIGPMLNGIVGRKAGTIPGFSYSEANKEADAKGLLWTEDNLFKYLENPAAFMPGNNMKFVGVKDEADRRDLIAYLKQQPGN